VKLFGDERFIHTCEAGEISWSTDLSIFDEMLTENIEGIVVARRTC
jgi:hypothetical protein